MFKKSLIQLLGGCVLSVMIMANASSQTLDKTSTEILQNTGLQDTTQLQQIAPVANEGSLSEEQPPTEIEIPDGQGSQAEPEVFGASLFKGQAVVSRVAPDNPVYRISTGDRISIQMWGAKSLIMSADVDSQGNIFIPDVGPVYLKGVPKHQLNSVMTNAIRKVFVDNVKIYANLLNTQPIGVFVTGPVKRPGRYAGDRIDTAIYYLQQAGGIDLERGSFRNITVMRGNRKAASLDLYQFLYTGEIDNFQFENNDVIVVSERLPTITTKGKIRNSYVFELGANPGTGSYIKQIAGPQPDVTHVIVNGAVGGDVYSDYVPIEAFDNRRLNAGDTIEFISDAVGKNILVKVDGVSDGPSYVVLPRWSTVYEALARIEVDPDQALPDSVYLKRESVAEKQLLALQQSLSRLQRSVLTAKVTTESESGIRAQEAALVEKFIEKAQALKPEGRVVLASQATHTSTTLEDGDTIVVPSRTNTVMIVGEVEIPQTVLYDDRYHVSDYIEHAGGFSERANDDDFLVLRQNGQLIRGSDIAIQPGDQIMVLPDSDSRTFLVMKDIIDVLYKVALATGVVVKIFDD
ncbi:polysaccharide biosynthesis/export family protein [Sneathiella limimaris]|uniref:polysaccharide biosynthesis/export family protein n=1 Tax=Sneathiella limimaris TaxID=1964213 RepID=UPI00146A4F09|nr:polysaccharide biosynthesis/export family protein [Sneathiella limimaris]